MAAPYPSPTNTPSVDHKQILKAALALVRNLESHSDETKIDQPSLLENDNEENRLSRLDVPVWLVITAKQHIATSHSLKPGKAAIPHPLYSSPETRICLIVADPPPHASQTYKNLINHPNFSQDLRAKLVKVIAYSKLKRKYKDYDKRRQLFAGFDLFLADERIVHLLPVALGRTFYKSTTKRPIPVSLTGKENWGTKQAKTVFDRLKPKIKSPSLVVGKPADVVADIERALTTTSIHLAPSTSICIKVAYAGWPSEWIAENTNAVIARAVAKYVPNEWQGLKSLHLKGPASAALPIWLADEIWCNENDIKTRNNTVHSAVAENYAKGGMLI